MMVIENLMKQNNITFAEINTSPCKERFVSQSFKFGGNTVMKESGMMAFNNESMENLNDQTLNNSTFSLTSP